MGSFSAEIAVSHRPVSNVAKNHITSSIEAIIEDLETTIDGDPAQAVIVLNSVTAAVAIIKDRMRLDPVVTEDLFNKHWKAPMRELR